MVGEFVGGGIDLSYNHDNHHFQQLANIVKEVQDSINKIIESSSQTLANIDPSLYQSPVTLDYGIANIDPVCINHQSP